MTSVDTLSKFGTAFQAKSIAVMLTDKQFLDQAQDIIEPKHFESEAHAWIVDRILWYFHEYKNLPSMEVFKKEIDKVENDAVLKVSVISALKDVYHNIKASDIKYIKDEFLVFCKNQAIKAAILASADKLQTGDYDGIKTIVDKAMKAGQERNYGHNWKIDIDERVLHAARNTVSTGWSVIDQIMDGGLADGELGIVVAPPGVGKSWALAHIGKAALQNGKKVLHYTFELSEKYVGLRYDTLFTGIEPNKIRLNVDAVKKAIDGISGELILKYYPTRSSTTNVLRAHIERLLSTNFNPDLLIIDYADLMRPTEKSDARYQDLGVIYEDIRGLAGELGIPSWSASQSQRSSIQDDVIEGDKIAESFGKLMIADFVMSISRKLPDKVSSTARAHVIKNRFGPDGITCPAHFNPVKGEFEIFDENSAEGIRVKKQMQDGDNILKTLLQKKMLEFNDKNADEMLG